jgi:DNA-binding transcriptional regulator LsrR (DeoR family)
LRIPIRIGIGGVSKIRGIKASLKKGIINILITDREACSYLLEKGG